MMDRVHELAVAIADEAARSDIECRCAGEFGQRHAPAWDTSKVDPIDRADVDRALEYMALRGDALSFTVARDGDVVRFGRKL